MFKKMNWNVLSATFGAKDFKPVAELWKKKNRVI